MRAIGLDAALSEGGEGRIFHLHEIDPFVSGVDTVVLRRVSQVVAIGASLGLACLTPTAGSPGPVPVSISGPHPTGSDAQVLAGGIQDSLSETEEGKAIDSKQWRTASFLNRIKRQVAEHWHAEEAYRRRDPTGSVYGHQHRLTVLRVQLGRDGQLVSVALNQSSGVEFLDDEAFEAFKAAQPFPSPPPHLVDANGVLNFRFGFRFEPNSIVPEPVDAAAPQGDAE